MKNKIIFSISLFFSSLVFNFIWETFNLSFCLSNTLGFNSSLTLLTYASFVDGLIIISVYLFLGFIFRKFYWFSDKKILIFFIIILITISVLIEERALLTERWIYSEDMPTLFGIALLPLIQLAITGALSIFLVEKFTLFKCDICGLKYRTKEQKEKCQKWCENNKTCNFDIIKKEINFK